MLNKETKDKLVAYGFDVSKLEGVVKSESEESLDVPNLKTNDEFSKLVSEDDKKVFGNNRFDEGKKAFSEIYAKELKKKYEIEVDGKDPGVIIEAIFDKKVAELGAKPNELAADKKILQQKLAESDQKLLDKITEFNNKLSNIENRSQVGSIIPNEGMKNTKQQLENLFFFEHRVLKEDGRNVTYIGDEKLVDSNLEPIPLDVVINSWLDEGKFRLSNGMEGKDGKGKGGSSAKFKTLNEFNDWCKKQDPPINAISEEGQKILVEKKDETVSSEAFYNS